MRGIEGLTQAEEDRHRMLQTLMEEWSPLQRDLMARLFAMDDDPMDLAVAARHGADVTELRRQRIAARVRLQEALRLRAVEDGIA